MSLFVLIHSPLVGPYTWQPVAEELRSLGVSALVPSIRENERAPYWKAHVAAIVSAVKKASADSSLVLVGHSGGGMLLPSLREALGHPVAGYIFADAGIPENGVSRLDAFRNPEEAARFREAASGGLLPAWTEEDLREVIPDAATRIRYVGEFRPLPLAVYEEPIPVFSGWPEAPCGYLGFRSPESAGEYAYADSLARARQAGWPMIQLPGEHFHMLVDPPAVARALLALQGRMGI